MSAMKTDATSVTGAAVVDVTHRLEDLLIVSLMTPMSRRGPLSVDAAGNENCCWGLPLNQWGLPSTAKSDKTEQAALKTALPMSVIYPSQNQPEDFGNMPVVMRLAAPTPGGVCDGVFPISLLSQVTELNLHGKGVLFVDEGSTAAPAVQASMLSMVLARKVGCVPIAGKIRILLAANPPEHAVGGYPYEPALANRMAHVYVNDPPPEEWWNYLVTDDTPQTIATEDLENKVKTNWVTARPYAVSNIIGFTRANPDKIKQQPAKGHPQGSYAWPSMRTWDMAGKALAAAKALGYDDEIEQMVIEACVGEGLGVEWAAWKAAADIPEPQDVLDNGWNPDKDRLDRTMAVSSGITSFVMHQPDINQKYMYAAKAWEWFARTIKDYSLGDIVVAQCQSFLTAGLGGKRSQSPDYLKRAARSALSELDNLGLTEFVSA